MSSMQSDEINIHWKSNIVLKINKGKKREWKVNITLE